MIIDAIGLKGHDDNSEKETADLTTLPVQAKRAAVTLLRLFKLEVRSQKLEEKKEK